MIDMKTYYVKCKGTYGTFFSFQDGHFTASEFRLASGTNSFKEAIRMLDYARTLDHEAKIVSVSLNVTVIDNHDEQIHDELLKSAREKLTNEECLAVRQQWTNHFTNDRRS